MGSLCLYGVVMCPMGSVWGYDVPFGVTVSLWGRDVSLWGHYVSLWGHYEPYGVGMCLCGVMMRPLGSLCLYGVMICPYGVSVSLWGRDMPHGVIMGL